MSSGIESSANNSLALAPTWRADSEKKKDRPGDSVDGARRRVPRVEEFHGGNCQKTNRRREIEISELHSIFTPSVHDGFSRTACIYGFPSVQSSTSPAIPGVPSKRACWGGMAGLVRCPIGIRGFTQPVPWPESCIPLSPYPGSCTPKAFKPARFILPFEVGRGLRMRLPLISQQ